MSSGLTPGGRSQSVRRERGFTVIEALFVVGVVLVMTAMAIPLVQSTLAYYDLQAAVSGVSGAIQSTRFHAISDGYPYRITFDSATNTYQVASCPVWNPTTPDTCVFSNVGGPIPFGSSHVKLGTNASLRFRPSGVVLFLVGSSPITLSREISSTTRTKSLTVSNYGSVTVE